MNDAPELLPCPFCGKDAGPLADATRILGSWNIVHRCKVIGTFKIERSTRELTIAAWNTRAPEALATSDTVRALVKAAVEAERERCAGVCDLRASQRRASISSSTVEDASYYLEGAKALEKAAAAIRAEVPK